MLKNKLSEYLMNRYSNTVKTVATQLLLIRQLSYNATFYCLDITLIAVFKLMKNEMISLIIYFFDSFINIKVVFEHRSI